MLYGNLCHKNQMYHQETLLTYWMEVHYYTESYEAGDPLMTRYVSNMSGMWKITMASQQLCLISIRMDPVQKTWPTNEELA